LMSIIQLILSESMPEGISPGVSTTNLVSNPHLCRDVSSDRPSIMGGQRSLIPGPPIADARDIETEHPFRPYAIDMLSQAPDYLIEEDITYSLGGLSLWAVCDGHPCDLVTHDERNDPSADVS
jgi:hypothetical protein